MFSFEFETWTDILLEHYVLTLLTCIIAVIVTFIISRKYNIDRSISKNSESAPGDECFKTDQEKYSNTSTTSVKRLPALAAERVIQANMTEEQRLLEYQVRQKQLARIYELMQKQSDKFGNISLSEVEEQMKLYQ